MIWIQLAILIFFYGTLIVVIIVMVCKYKKECREMEENKDTDDRYRMVKRLMAQYDQRASIRPQKRDTILSTPRDQNGLPILDRGTIPNLEDDDSNRYSALIMNKNEQQYINGTSAGHKTSLDDLGPYMFRKSGRD